MTIPPPQKKPLFSYKYLRLRKPIHKIINQPPPAPLFPSPPRQTNIPNPLFYAPPPHQSHHLHTNK
ncbi:hypothetical protein M430DRAFT_33164 [Amorphotheca resinae ATCC 22711]|uniref:Uncharacterized protein n=1 Tax=Amorphotheca resinae ATCC 22711 TaxID=857342 RepID=A0A2T3BB09_AMORE|nr:hypothetical protein M430DRAFT_33164 [Amorphotheca resinae ATCC 22711]PSS25454.1 hypothetical protein M430DRAFT_33164 [Amorphotheca resinae ATCC 22711]